MILAFSNRHNNLTVTWGKVDGMQYFFPRMTVRVQDKDENICTGLFAKQRLFHGGMLHQKGSKQFGLVIFISYYLKTKTSKTLTPIKKRFPPVPRGANNVDCFLHRMRVIDVFSSRPHWIVCGLGSMGTPNTPPSPPAAASALAVTNVSSIALKRTCLLN